MKAVLALKVSKRERRIVYAASALIAASVLLTATLVYPGFNKHPEYDTYFILALVIGLFPPAAADLLDRRWRAAVDSKIPEFIRVMLDAQKTGMPFTKALEHASETKYGPLTKELKRSVALVSWGWTYEEALSEFAERVDTPLAYRTATLLSEVGHSGGRLTEILEGIYTHLREVQSLEQDRKRQIAPYVMVIYVSFGVFLFTTYILFTTFFSQVKAIAAEGLMFSGIDPGKYYIWFLHMSVIEALISGFVAGKIGEGAMSAGLKHALILLAASLLVFKLLIPSP